MSAAARPAALQAAVETETPEGGRLRAWSDVAAVWVVLSYDRLTSAAAEEMRPVQVEAATAVARNHPAAAAGQRLAVDGDPAPWRVLAVRRDQPARGRMTLTLDRPAA